VRLGTSGASTTRCSPHYPCVAMTDYARCQVCVESLLFAAMVARQDRLWCGASRESQHLITSRDAQPYMNLTSPHILERLSSSGPRTTQLSLFRVDSVQTLAWAASCTHPVTSLCRGLLRSAYLTQSPCNAPFAPCLPSPQSPCGLLLSTPGA
jgi:hypothetical protein